MEQHEKPNGVLLTAVAIGTGIVNGLFGAGGGMIAVVVLERLLKLDTQKAHATALIIMLPLSVISIIIYFIRGAVGLDLNLLFVTLGMLPGSFLGAKLLGCLKSAWVDRLFCILMLAAGVRLIV